MAQYVAFRPGIEMRTQGMQMFFELAGRRFAPMLKKAMVKHGLNKLKDTEWVPLQVWLDAQREIAETIGENTLFTLGKKVLEVAVWPPGLDTIDAALASIDTAYHLNHRLDGKVMFDTATGVMKEGIGHYRSQPDGDRCIAMTCDTPYASEYDRGIITGTARRFKPAAEVTLDESRPTRRRGADSCTYIVRW